MQETHTIDTMVAQVGVKQDQEGYTIDRVTSNLKVLSEILIGEGALTTQNGKIYRSSRIWTALGWKPDRKVFKNTFKVARDIFFGFERKEPVAFKQANAIRNLYEEAIRGLDRTQQYMASDVEFSESLQRLIKKFAPPEYNGITLKAAMKNQETLARFNEEVKPVMDLNQQTISEESRLIVWAARAFFGGFNKEILEKTIEKAVIVIKLAAEGCERLKPIAEEMKSCYEEHREGVRKIARTYLQANNPVVAQELYDLLEKYTLPSYQLMRSTDPIPIPQNQSPMEKTKEKTKRRLDRVLSKPPKAFPEKPVQEKPAAPKRTLGTNPYNVKPGDLARSRLRKQENTGEKKKNSTDNDLESSDAFSEFQKKYKEMLQQRLQPEKKQGVSQKETALPPINAPKVRNISDKREKFIRQSKEKGKKTIELIRKTTKRLPNPFHRNHKKEEKSNIEEEIKVVEEAQRNFRPKSLNDLNTLLLSSHLLTKSSNLLTMRDGTDEAESELDDSWNIVNPHDEDEYAKNLPPLLRSVSERAFKSKPALKNVKKSPLEEEQTAELNNNLLLKMKIRRLSIEGKNIQDF